MAHDYLVDLVPFDVLNSYSREDDIHIWHIKVEEEILHIRNFISSIIKTHYQHTLGMASSMRQHNC